MTESIWVALALAPIAFLGATVYGLTGFGSSLVTIPLSTHFLPLPFALAVFSVVDLLNALRIGLADRRFAVTPELVRMVPLMLLGILAGVTVLVNLPRQMGMLALGVFVLAYSVYALTYRGGLRTLGRGWAYAAGFCGGILGGLFGAGGAPYAIYLSHRPISKEQYRATLTLAAVFSVGMRAIVFTATGLLAQEGVWIAVAAAVPAAFLGLAVGSRAFKRISRERLLQIIALVLFATGTSLVIRSSS